MASWSRCLLLVCYLTLLCSTNLFAQLLAPNSAQVKISAQPFQVANTQHLNQIVWTMLGRTARETIYCVSEAPVSQLRFVCVDCSPNQKNISDIVDVLNSAQDLTRTAGFPTIQLQNVEANVAWNGATIICQAAINGGLMDSPPAVIDVRYLRQVHVVDASGQGPVLIPNQGYHFYVECTRGSDGQCQQAQRRKTLHCSVQAHPSASSFRWLKNGGPISGNGPEITIGTEMIGHSLQCSANNGLFGDDWPSSQAVFIDPYSAAHLLQDNFGNIQELLSQGNRVEINQRLSLNCVVEGNPRPVIFWRMRRLNGQVIDAPCPQGLSGQYQEVAPTMLNQLRLNATCDLQITNYSFSGQYWCSACSYVSQGMPECSPRLEAPGERLLNIQVQGPPQQSDLEPSVEQYDGESRAVILVYYCAEPAPILPRDLVFSIDGNDLQVGQTWQNYHFESNSMNNSLPNCYFARLRLAPIHDDDQSRQIQLKIQNKYGAKQIIVSMSDLLGVSGTELGGMPAWLIALLTVIAGILIFTLVLIFCIRSQLLCFDQVKDLQTQYSNDNLKSGIHDIYNDDAPCGGATSPCEVIRSNLGNGIQQNSGVTNEVYTLKNGIALLESFSFRQSHKAENPYDLAVHAAFSQSRMSSV